MTSRQIWREKAEIVSQSKVTKLQGTKQDVFDYERIGNYCTEKKIDNKKLG
jgi:hypothetical protein